MSEEYREEERGRGEERGQRDDRTGEKRGERETERACLQKHPGVGGLILAKQPKLIPLWFKGRWETEQHEPNNANTNEITVI